MALPMPWAVPPQHFSVEINIERYKSGFKVEKTNLPGAVLRRNQHDHAKFGRTLMQDVDQLGMLLDKTLYQ